MTTFNTEQTLQDLRSGNKWGNYPKDYIEKWILGLTEELLSVRAVELSFLTISENYLEYIKQPLVTGNQLVIDKINNYGKSTRRS